MHAGGAGGETACTNGDSAQQVGGYHWSPTGPPWNAHWAWTVSKSMDMLTAGRTVSKSKIQLKTFPLGTAPANWDGTESRAVLAPKAIDHPPQGITSRRASSAISGAVWKIGQEEAFLIVLSEGLLESIALTGAPPLDFPSVVWSNRVVGGIGGGLTP